MFHILDTIDKEWNDSTNRAEKKAENCSKDVSQVAILVGDIGSDQVVSIGTCDLNRVLTKNYLYK